MAKKLAGVTLGEPNDKKAVTFDRVVYLEDIEKARAMGAGKITAPRINYRDFLTLKKRGGDLYLEITEGFGDEN